MFDMQTCLFVKPYCVYGPELYIMLGTNEWCYLHVLGVVSVDIQLSELTPYYIVSVHTPTDHVESEMRLKGVAPILSTALCV